MVCFASAIVYASEVNSRETPIVKVVRDRAASVVNISTERILFLRQNPFWGRYGSDFDNLFDQFFAPYGMASAMKLRSVGSGVIIDKSGLIVTNAHVVNMASTIYVILNEGTQVKGEVVYENRNDDLAFIKIVAPKPLVEAELGQTKDLMLGETVVAIGNPLGLENTVTSGIVSGKNRKFYSSQGELILGDMLQIDAPINPGNSGGALFNLEGKLIGINIAVVQYSQNIGFAIPVEKIDNALQDYKHNVGVPVRYNRNNFLKQTYPAGSLPNVSSEQWDPWGEMDRMRKQMNWLMQDTFDRFGSQKGAFNSDIFYDTNLNMEETPNEYIYKMDIADLNKNKVNVEINRNSLTVTGEYSSSTEEKKTGSTFSSHAFGSFVRTVPLPEDSDPNGVKTEMQGNTFIVHIAKSK
jgi:S1-C subfamily serine protease/HSP20 family molecular chaperone IbpA